jgi:hypothetical protein
MRGGLKVLSGRDVVDILAAFGFVAIGGTKHFKVRRTSPGGDETLIIPNHDPVAKGTCARSSRRHPGMSRKRI